MTDEVESQTQNTNQWAPNQSSRISATHKNEPKLLMCRSTIPQASCILREEIDKAIESFQSVFQEQTTLGACSLYLA